MADKDMKWKTLSQKYLIEKPWLTARVDKVELPTGAIIDEYYVLEYPDWVNTIAITKEGEFVFVRQYRYAIGKTVNELCASRSEIVVPVIRNGEVIAVLDIDSEHLNTFDDIDKEWLEKVAELFAAKAPSQA